MVFKIYQIIGYNLALSLYVLSCLFSLLNGQRVTSNMCYCTSGPSLQCNGNSVCTSDCNNVTRASNEYDCVFPFRYKCKWYNSCIKLDRSSFWCSLDKIYAGRFATCSGSCPKLAQNLVKNSGDTHTVCVPPCSGVQLIFPSASDIQTILNVHNQYRSSVNPTASDMIAMSWDDGLAQVAFVKAQTGSGEHDCDSCRKLLNNYTTSVGQNLWWGSGRTIPTNTASFWTSIVNSWASEIEYFSYGDGSTTGYWEDVGHYTQIISAGTTRVGCGAAICSSGTYAICNYASYQGDVSKPYTSGPSCQKCSSANCRNKLCYCNKFCQNFGTLDPVSCTCKCQPYAYGPECEFKTCNKTDTDFGCWNIGNDCDYANTYPLCPHKCGICDYI